MLPVEPDVNIPKGWRYVVYAKNQKEYLPLPALVENSVNGHVVTRWKLDWKERLKIVLFGNLWLTLITFHQPLQPVILTADFPLRKEL